MATIQRTGPQLNQLLSKLGMSESFVREQAQMLSASSLGALRQLEAGYFRTETAAGAGATRFQAMLHEENRALPPFGWNRPPSRMQEIMEPLCGAGCAGHEAATALESSSDALVKRLAHPRRRHGAKLERLLRTNPHARAAFEASVGGQVTNFGRRDGRVMVQRFTASTHAMGAPNPAQPQVPATTALGIFAQMEHAIMEQARRVAAVQSQSNTGEANSYAAVPGTSHFNAMMVGGLGSMVGGSGFGAFGNALGGAGVGSWNPDAMPGRIQNTNPIYERAHQAEVDGVLNDPSLTVEDKVTLMLMLVANKQDNDIQRQGQYINSVQQQQSNRSGTKVGAPSKVGAMSGALGGAAVNAAGMGGLGPLGAGSGSLLGGQAVNSPSIDVETMKLKRMIDKRSQMFDTLRSIIDKYNETAKNIIQSIGR